MKNRIQLLLAAALAFSAASVIKADSSKSCGDCPSNKTYVSQRSDGANLALEMSAGWTNLMRHYNEDAFGGKVQGVFFMSGSTDEKKLAQAFLCAPAACPTTCPTDCAPKCGGDCASMTFPRTDADSDALATGALTDLGFFIHDFDAEEAALSTDTTLTLCPERETIGVQFWYNQDLKCLLDGLYFQIHVPVVHVEHKLGMNTSGTEKDELKKFFQGTRTQIDAGTQDAFKNLCCAKMTACGCDRSETGVADVDLMLGYKVFDKRAYHVGVAFGLTIPTGNTPDGKYLWDAVVGNGGHLGVGFRVDGHYEFWESDCRNHSLVANMAMNYRYLLKDDECRTLGLCVGNANQCLGHYALLIDRTVQPNAQQLTPAANVTTLRVDVTPGSQFDGVLSLNYNFCNWAFDLGYNLFLRSGEKVCLKKNCAVSCETTCETKCCGKNFVDGKWAVAQRDADMTATRTLPFGETAALDDAHALFNVNTANLSVKSAETKSLTTHKLFGGVGYLTKDWEVPVLVGVGAHYEWADCDVVANWGFNARLGVGF